MWRELYRECVCRLDVVSSRNPIPSLRITWPSKSGSFPRDFVDFAGDPTTCQIHPSVYIEGPAPIVIGSGVTIEEGVTLATSAHRLEHGQFMRGVIEARSIVVEEGVTIGRGSIICGGALLGKGCRIEPDSVVSGSIEAGATARGIPAKPHLTYRLKTAGILPRLINKVGAKSYLNANIALIRNFFGDQITIGADTFSNREIFIHGKGRLKIGARVMFAPRAEIDLSDESAESIIEDDVWVGGGAKLIAPFHVRKQSILAAGCHFTGMNRRSGVWGGRPAYLIHHDTATAHLVHQ